MFYMTFIPHFGALLCKEIGKSLLSCKAIVVWPEEQTNTPSNQIVVPSNLMETFQELKKKQTTRHDREQPHQDLAHLPSQPNFVGKGFCLRKKLAIGSKFRWSVNLIKVDESHLQ